MKALYNIKKTVLFLIKSSAQQYRRWCNQTMPKRAEALATTINLTRPHLKLIKTILSSTYTQLVTVRIKGRALILSVWAKKTFKYICRHT